MLEAGVISESSVTATGLEPTTTYFINGDGVIVYELSACGFKSRCSQKNISSKQIWNAIKIFLTSKTWIHANMSQIYMQKQGRR